MQLTDPIRKALWQVRIALAQGFGFEPSQARHRFRLAVTDYGDMIVVPPLIRALRARAPGLDIEVRPTVKGMATMM